ncbi:ADP-ribosylation factor 6 protein [Rutstroemia sp. NJR-2017a BVV2]|nr:ADP-ribosylation factor 6 protein [Rutstroemia sp. NJR-2017a WRK4]PQE19296.1 ADP-ribosylation factor 6 protein [Rutstroemia sp. NJR-2017a BVV2]
MGGAISKMMGKIFGSKEMRLLMLGTQGLIFVVDSSDKARIQEAQQELHRIINDREMQDALLLVFANKKDIAGCLTPTEVTTELKLNELKGRTWFVVPSCATTGEGLMEGLAWLSKTIEGRPAPQAK